MRSKVLVEKKEGAFFANLRRMHKKIVDIDPAIIEKAIEEAIQESGNRAKRNDQGVRAEPMLESL